MCIEAKENFLDFEISLAEQSTLLLALEVDKKKLELIQCITRGMN